MCLKLLNSETKTKKLKDSIPPEGIIVYKVVAKREGKYHPIFQHIFTSFVHGVNKANIKRRIRMTVKETYQAGFHFFLKKEDAIKYRNSITVDEGYIFGDTVMIECIIKKSWITSTGQNEIILDLDGNDIILAETIVTNKAIFPKCS